MHDRSFHRTAFSVALAMMPGAVLEADPANPVNDTPYEKLTPKLFDVRAKDILDDDVPLLTPWKVVTPEEGYRGAWVVTGDLTGDGQREIVTARTLGEGDERYTCSAAAFRLDGSVLWRWGEPSAGSGKINFDVACQIYDWDGDDRNDVIVSTDKAIVELDGRTGEEKRRFPIPPRSADCIVFCNLTGAPGRATDVLVKTRYSKIWAFNREGHELWSIEHPGGHLTAHQPRPIDIDGDGRDEIMVGYTLLDPDGSVGWKLDDTYPYADGTNPRHGHLDCARVLQRGPTPAETHLVLTFCSGNRVARVDGQGRFVWRVAGAHFESADVGRICPGVPGRHIAVDIDHQKPGQSPLCIFSERGELLGRIVSKISRHHLLIDWTDDGFDSIIVGEPPAMYDGRGRPILRFDIPEPPAADAPDHDRLICAESDMDGDGRPDVLFWTNPGTAIWIYRNENGKPADPPQPSHSDNFTFY